MNILIAGGGIAGTVLSIELLRRGCSVQLMDDPFSAAASAVAAGLINPIPGKRYEIAWLYQEFLQAARQFYAAFSLITDRQYLKDTTILRIFGDEKEMKTFAQKSIAPEYQQYIGDIFSPRDNALYPALYMPYGGFRTLQAATFDYPLFLSDARQWLQKQTGFRFIPFRCNPNNCIYADGQWRVQSKRGALRSDALIFCDGWQGMHNPFFPWLKFDVTKGEMCIVHAPGLPAGQPISNGFAMIPAGGNDIYRCAATFAWNEFHTIPTQEGNLRLQARLHKLLRGDWTMLEQSAGIRPTVFDHKPLTGMHPEYQKLGIFNGMGTKGALYTPFFAPIMAQLVLDSSFNHPVPAADIMRWYTPEFT
jgi:glycine/D-amino acid oxidase-like deaminating enzyme